MRVLTSCLLFTVVWCNKLPFQCPYKIPDGDPQCTSTGDTGGGFCPLLVKEGGLNTNTSLDYNQYRAALALVPCDGQAISVYTTPIIKFEQAISVVFVFDKSVDKLKKWLE